MSIVPSTGLLSESDSGGLGGSIELQEELFLELLVVLDGDDMVLLE